MSDNYCFYFILSGTVFSSAYMFMYVCSTVLFYRTVEAIYNGVMGKIYITRHGETFLNTRDCFQGAADDPSTYLTERGKQQAGLLAKRMEDIPLDLILSSPLKRAIDTAEIIRRERDIPLLIENGLLERRLGVWEGRTHSSVREELGMSKEDWKKGVKTVPEGGESEEELLIRAQRDFQRIADTYIDKDILLVTHCVILQPIFAYIKKEPVEPMVFAPQASLSLCEYDGKDFTLLYEADTSHIK